MAQLPHDDIPAEQMDPETWTNPAGHFKPRHKMLSLYVDRSAVIAQWNAFKVWALKGWSTPWISPLYFAAMHNSQRNRNLFLAENHMNYRPYKWRRNSESSKY